MTYKPLPSIDILRQLLAYDPETGLLAWLPRTDKNSLKPDWFNARYAGAEALGHVSPAGYKVGIINGATYYAHRIVWMMGYGSDPAGLQIDHINHEKSDNRLVNLRLATNSENQQNKAGKTNGTSVFKGVGFAKRQGKWQAFICQAGRKVHLGTFNNEIAAAMAYDTAALANHGRFALTNKKLGNL